MKQISRFCRGFSLVEVTIAIGIVAFAVLSCVGLNAVSLSSMKEARQMEIAGRIFRSIFNEGLVSEFSDLATLQGTKYFDHEGTILPGASAVSGAPYEAETTVQTVSVTDGSSPALMVESSLLVVKIYAAGQKALGKPSIGVAVMGNREKATP